MLFYFYPGIHTLNRSLHVENVHNLTIQDLSGSEPVILVINQCYLENCFCIKISSIDFYLTEYNKFSHIDLASYLNLYNLCSCQYMWPSTTKTNNIALTIIIKATIAGYNLWTAILANLKSLAHVVEEIWAKIMKIHQDWSYITFPAMKRSTFIPSWFPPIYAYTLATPTRRTVACMVVG